MQALDNFISPIPRFERDIPILAVLISAQTPSSESTDDSSANPGAGSSRTREGKHKATTTPPPSKKPKKIVGKSDGGIKINEPTSKPSSTLAPPLGPQKKFPIR
jgi:hypothetical protein